MGKYYIKKDDLYVTYIDDGVVHYSKEEPVSGIADSLPYVEKQLLVLKEMGQGVGVIYERINTLDMEGIYLDDIEYGELEEGTYYIVVLDDGSYIGDYNNYGELLISKQRYLRMKHKMDVERVLKALERYRIERYQLMELTEKKEMVVV